MTKTTEKARRAGRPSEKPRTVNSDGKLYVSLHHAAKIAGVSHVTMYNWIKREQKAGTSLDLLVDTVAHQRFISETCLDVLIQRRYQPALPLSTMPTNTDELVSFIEQIQAVEWESPRERDQAVEPEPFDSTCHIRRPTS
jgi:hypothetical protein